MKLILASSNPGKLREFRTILDGKDLCLLSQKEAGLDLVVEETGTTFEENAELKARAVLNAAGLAAIADDSGLMVDALGGAPGVYSHRFGDQPDDAARCRYLLRQIADVPDEKRTAKFVCSIVCLFPDGQKITATGECRGILLREMRGSDGFGYDPVFCPLGSERTFAEFSQAEKNTVSHRGAALRQFQKQFEEWISFHADK